MSKFIEISEYLKDVKRILSEYHNDSSNVDFMMSLINKKVFDNWMDSDDYKLTDEQWDSVRNEYITYRNPFSPN